MRFEPTVEHGIKGKFVLCDGCKKKIFVGESIYFTYEKRMYHDKKCLDENWNPHWNSNAKPCLIVKEESVEDEY